MPYMIVVAGEALMDRLVRPDGTIVEVPGGGPFNTARTIARLGVPVAFLGCLSIDRHGQLLRTLLEGDGVDASLITTTDAPAGRSWGSAAMGWAMRLRSWTRSVSRSRSPAGQPRDAAPIRHDATSWAGQRSNSDAVGSSLLRFLSGKPQERLGHGKTVRCADAAQIDRNSS
jgi:pfkB family carbohydrate kinase